ncbi:DUF6701 domain-containing protein [Vibrio rhodolitus]|uniref:DUF6701 domain-containing protein n=1 Tax=Vibrio rhodolitus TaxID=2231649 RepID=UPI000E0B9B05|nr:DUF6701 domain-containing protein [Vibrio rhodolitus]
MKKIICLLLLSQLSFVAKADNDVLEHCQINFNQDFTVTADYGEYQRIDRTLKHSSIDNDILYFGSIAGKKVALWSDDDDDNAIFSEDSIDDDKYSKIRFDYRFVNRGSGGENGEITYYLQQDGVWSAGETKSLSTNYGNHRTWAYLVREDDDEDDNESLRNLTCSELAPVPDAPIVDYEFGVVEGLDCTHGCNVLFQKEYKNPIVFLMSTIDPENITKSVPTKSSVANVWGSKKGVTIESESAPGNTSSDRMSPIYYFVTEPGKLKFYNQNNQEIYGEAGIITTAKSQCKKNNDKKNKNTNSLCDEWESVPYQYGSISDAVIMAQVQGKDSDWATTAISSINRQGFNLALERGRQGPMPGERAKEIAYLAVPEFHGTDESKNNNIEFYRGSKKYNQGDRLPEIESIGWSCKNNQVSLHQSFKKFGVIVNKQTRDGGDGGWLRYCKQYEESGTPKFTFAFDEDADSLVTRRHSKPESIGYFAFEVPEVEIPLSTVCNLFPEPIQSWTGVDSVLTVSNQSVRFNGWSQGYIERHLKRLSDGYKLNYESVYTTKNEFLPLGFDAVPYDHNNNPLAYQMYNFPVCNGVQCDVGNSDGNLSSRKVDGNNVRPLMPIGTSGSLTIAANNDDIKLNCGNNSSICSYEESGKNVDITIKRNLTSLKINKYGNDYKLVRVKFIDGIYISDLTISNGSNVELVFAENQSITFDTYHHESGNVKYVFGSGVQINIVTSFTMSQKVEILPEDAYPILYGPNAKVYFHGSGSKFKGFILADHLSLNSSAILGAATVRTTAFNSNVSIDKPDYACELPPEPQGSLVVTPLTRFGLTCDRIAVKFTLEEDGSIVDSNDNFTATVTPSGTTWCSNPSGDCGLPRFSFENGSKILYLDSRYIGEYSVGGEYNAIPARAKDVEFLPFNFSFDSSELNVIAGQLNKNFVVKVMACDGSGAPTVVNYDKSLAGEQHISLNIEQPDSGESQISLLEYQPVFKAGTATSDIKIQESGQFTVTLTDSEFDCEGFDDCPIEGKAKLTGSFTLKSRPYKLAICDVKAVQNPAKKNPGSTNSGAGFIAADEEFSVTYRPIVHTDSRQSASEGDWCSYPVTSNYSLDDGPLVLNYTLAYPDLGIEGQLSSAEDLSFVPASTTLTLKHRWSEAGTLALTTSAKYFDVAIEDDLAYVGRFYPKYFRISELSTPVWQYASGQSFNYMNQPFDNVSFTVDAANANGEPTFNYQGFDQALRAKFVLNDPSNRFISPVIESNAWNNTTRSLGEYEGASSGSCGDSSSLCWQKLPTAPGYEDGPFNLLESGDEDFTAVTNIAIIDGGSVDPVEIKTGEGKLTVQPDLRFGRASLSSVGGVVSDSGIKVPLRLEYWNGSRFITNSDDSSTEVKGSNLVASNNVLWSDVEPPAVPAEVSLSGGGSVEEGLSHSIIAKQDKLERQQTQVWLELIDANNDLPWLQYLWDADSGAEGNPSTVVTFGIYRGNDKIIFRGESGLTGQ